MSKLLFFIAAIAIVFFGFVRQTTDPGVTMMETVPEADQTELSSVEEEQPSSRPDMTQPAEEKEPTMNIADAGSIKINNTVIQIEVADSPLEQYRGLSGRASLCENCGMLFVWDEPRIQNFSMRDMKFALDFVFIQNMKVVEIRENIRPPTETGSTTHIQSSLEADMVLELNTGFAAENNITPGDVVAIDQ